MKKYYVNYWKNFGNTYNLYWAETPEQIKKAENLGYERITRKEAERLCAEENYRRKYDYNFSNFASPVILPIDYDNEEGWENDRKVYKDGYMILYI